MSWETNFDGYVHNQNEKIKDLQEGVEIVDWMKKVEGHFVAPNDFVEEGIITGTKFPYLWRVGKEKNSGDIVITPLAVNLDMKKLLFYHDKHYWLMMANKHGEQITSMVVFGFPIVDSSGLNKKPNFAIRVKLYESKYDSYSHMKHDRRDYVGFSDLRDVLQNPNQHIDTQICVPTYDPSKLINIFYGFIGQKPTVKYRFGGESEIAQTTSPADDYEGDDYEPIEVKRDERGFSFSQREPLRKKSLEGLFEMTPTLNRQEHPDFWKQEANPNLKPLIPFGGVSSEIKSFIRANTFLSAAKKGKTTLVDVSDVKWLKRHDFPPPVKEHPLEETEPLTSEYHHKVLLSRALDSLKLHIFVPKNPINVFQQLGLMNYRGL